MSNLTDSGLTLSKDRIKFRQLPFYWRPLRSSSDYDLPASLPFELYHDATTGTWRQQPDDSVKLVLEAAYRNGSEHVGLMDEHGIGREYADDFLQYIDHFLFDVHS